MCSGKNKFVKATDAKTYYFDLFKDVGNNLKHEIYFIIKHQQFLAEKTTKDEFSQFFFKCKHGNDIQEHEKQ